jgi:hypothetical protein
MELLLIGGLLVLVVHAACKANAAEQAATAAQATGVPPNTAVAPTGTTSTPSPATALGAPGAHGQYETQLDTNAAWPGNFAGYYTTTGTQPGTGGIPAPFVPGGAWNGFNAVPARTRQLNTAQQPGMTQTLAPGMTTPTPIFKL